MTGVLLFEATFQVLGNVIYVAIAAYTLWFSKTLRQIYFVIAMSAVVLIAGYIFAITLHNPSEQATYLVNRISAVVIICWAAFLTYHYQKSRAREIIQQKEIEGHKVAEEKLRSSQEMHTAIARNFPDGWIGILDKNLSYVFANGKGLRRIGTNSRDIAGKTFAEVVKSDSANVYLTAARDGKTVTSELIVNDRAFEVSASPFIESSINGWTLVVVHDITSLKETEMGLIKALETERKLSEMKSRFVTMALHEFRTPLATIMSSAALLAHYSDERYRQAKDTHVTRIKHSVNLLSGILDDFFSFQELENKNVLPKVEIVNLDNFLNEIADQAELLKRDNQRLIVKRSGCHEIVSDGKFLKTILQILLSNAFKYSFPDDHIELHQKWENDKLIFEVTDHGIGVLPADQEFIFDRFFRGQNAINIQGIGLGLCVARRYAKLLRGDIGFSSDPEVKTVFTVSIPAANL